jgi:hypothetical protein
VTRALGLLFAEIGELAAADVSLRETLHALSAQVVALLLGPLGAQILDKEDQQLKAFLRQSAWQYTSGPMEGRARGQFVRLLRPGVALGPWCVVPPRIEVSRAQKGRVHRFLEDFERAAGAAGAAGIAGAENLGADLRALADAYRDRDGPSLEADAQVLRELFACLGSNARSATGWRRSSATCSVHRSSGRGPATPRPRRGTTSSSGSGTTRRAARCLPSYRPA